MTAVGLWLDRNRPVEDEEDVTELAAVATNPQQAVDEATTEAPAPAANDPPDAEPAADEHGAADDDAGFEPPAEQNQGANDEPGVENQADQVEAVAPVVQPDGGYFAAIYQLPPVQVVGAALNGAANNFTEAIRAFGDYAWPGLFHPPT